jgi:hypothetical protein
MGEARETREEREQWLNAIAHDDQKDERKNSDAIREEERRDSQDSRLI